jgi:anti-sigma regulatory factor (Ser/Thr protein kinase)
VSKRPGGTQLIDLLLAELDSFTGAGWEQEDDITLVTLQRATRVRTASTGGRNGQVLAEFEVASEPGNEREVMARVVDAVQELELAESRLERLKTAVAEAAMNAIEHGNEGRAELAVTVEVVASDAELRIRITDQGGGPDMPQAETPDLEAKLAGLQKPRGWGLFLIENMVDEL